MRKLTNKTRAIKALILSGLGVPITGVLAFFFAGAIVFPIVEPFYAKRILASLGLMAVAYGVESVMRRGQITTCGFLSGNCSEHFMQHYALWLWALLLPLWLWGVWRWWRAAPDNAR